MTRIKEERDTLLNKSVHDIKITLREVDGKVDKLAGQIKRVEKDVDRKFSQDVRQKRTPGKLANYRITLQRQLPTKGLRGSLPSERGYHITS